MEDSELNTWIDSKLELIDKVFSNEIKALREKFRDNKDIVEVNMRRLFIDHHKTTPKNFFFFTTFNEGQFLTKIWVNKKDNVSYWLIYFGDELEGPPQKVHGGAIATALDQIVGLTAIFLRGNLQIIVESLFWYSFEIFFRFVCNGRIEC